MLCDGRGGGDEDWRGLVEGLGTMEAGRQLATISAIHKRSEYQWRAAAVSPAGSRALDARTTRSGL